MRVEQTMARTQQTARKSTGGKAPRKQLRCGNHIVASQIARRTPPAIHKSLVSMSQAVQLPRSGAGIKWHSANAVPENASVPISKTKSAPQKRVTTFKPVNRIGISQTVKSLLPFSPVIPRSYTSISYSSQLTGTEIPWNTFQGVSLINKKPSSTDPTDVDSLTHEQRKLNYERDGPIQLSDPLTDDEVAKLKMCITSAFKHPTKVDLWADPYFPGMAALLKWFSLFYDLKRERSLHLDVLKTLAQTESVKREIEELQRVRIYFFKISSCFLRVSLNLLKRVYNHSKPSTPNEVKASLVNRHLRISSSPSMNC